VTSSDVLWPPRRRRSIGSASGGPSAVAERLPAVVLGATELLLLEFAINKIWTYNRILNISLTWTKTGIPLTETADNKLAVS